MNDTPQDGFEKMYAHLDDAKCEELERRIVAEGDLPPEPMVYRNPDPFGLDWEWVAPDGSDSELDDEEIARPFSEPAQPAVRPRSPRLITSLAIAASIFGVLIGWFAHSQPGQRPDREVVLAQVGLKDGGPRGAGVVAVTVEVASPKPGFATVVVLSGTPQTFPLRDEDNISVQAEAASRYGPLETKPDTVVLVFVTETPARDTVRRAVAKVADPADSKAVREAVLSALWRDGYHWAAVQDSRVPASAPN